MLFLASIDRLNREELLDLLAFVEGATFGETLHEAWGATVVRAKKAASVAGHSTSALLKKAGRKVEAAKKTTIAKAGEVFNRVAATNEEMVGRFDSLRYEPVKLAEKVAAKRLELSSRDDAALRRGLLDQLCNLGAVPKKDCADSAVISRKVLDQVAKQMKIDTKMVAPEEVERIVFEKYVEDLLKKIQEALAKSGPEQEAELERELQESLGKMSRGNLEAMRKAMNLDELTARSLMGVFKSGGVTVATLTAVHAFGFGAFLALTTMIKALSLLIGVAFTFGTYTAATSFLGFLIGPGLPLAVLAAGGGTALWQRRKYRRSLLATLVAAMHAKLAADQ
jgi:hypothetical protein